MGLNVDSCSRPDLATEGLVAVTRIAGEAVGPGIAPEVTVGPLIDAKAVAKVTELVDDAAHRGAMLRLGGTRVGDAGYFFAPTVLTGAPEQSAITREEIFGPVASITTFTEVERALALADSTSYWLASYIYTRSLATAVRSGEALKVGMVEINQGLVSNPAAPFGGVKQSGFGRVGGPEGIEEYLETKYLGLTLEHQSEKVWGPNLLLLVPGN